MLHQRLIVLHSPSCVYKDDIDSLLLSFVNGFLSNLGRVPIIAFVIHRNLQTSSMRLQLLHGSRTEVVAGDQHNREIIVLEHVRDFGEIRGLPDSVDTDKSNYKGFALLLCLESLRHQVNVFLGNQNVLQLGSQFLFEKLRGVLEIVEFLILKLFLKIATYFSSDFFRHVFLY